MACGIFLGCNGDDGSKIFPLTILNNVSSFSCTLLSDIEKA